MLARKARAATTVTRIASAVRAVNVPAKTAAAAVKAGAHSRVVAVKAVDVERVDAVEAAARIQSRAVKNKKTEATGWISTIGRRSFF